MADPNLFHDPEEQAYRIDAAATQVAVRLGVGLLHPDHIPLRRRASVYFAAMLEHGLEGDPRASELISDAAHQIVIGQIEQ